MKVGLPTPALEDERVPFLKEGDNCELIRGKVPSGGLRCVKPLYNGGTLRGARQREFFVDEGATWSEK